MATASALRPSKMADCVYPIRLFVKPIRPRLRTLSSGAGRERSARDCVGNSA